MFIRYSITIIILLMLKVIQPDILNISVECGSGYSWSSEAMQFFCALYNYDCSKIPDIHCGKCNHKKCLRYLCPSGSSYFSETDTCGQDPLQCPENSTFNDNIQLCTLEPSIICIEYSEVIAEKIACLEKVLCPILDPEIDCVFPETMIKCPPMTRYDDTRQVCMAAPRKPACPDMSEVNQKGVYTQCINNYRTLPLCQPGTHWNDTVRSCTAFARRIPCPDLFNCPQIDNCIARAVDREKLSNCKRTGTRCPDLYVFDDVTNLCILSPGLECSRHSFFSQQTGKCHRPSRCTKKSQICFGDSSLCLKHPCQIKKRAKKLMNKSPN